MKHTQKLYMKLCGEVRTKYSISQSEFDVIAFLNNHPQLNTAKDVCEMRRLTKSCVSVAVDRLSRLGYISCTADGQDRRIVRINFMEKSAELRSEIKLVQNKFISLVFSGISPDAIGTFSDILTEMSKNIESAMGEDRL